MPARSAVPTALADQLRAATDHAQTTLARTGAALDAPVRAVASPWIAEQIAALLDALTAGTLTRCPHLTTAPRVAFTAAWAPGRLTCPACLPDAEDESACDRCGQHATGLHPGLAAVGPVLVAYGLCCTCLDQTGLNPAGEPHHRPGSVNNVNPPRRPA